MRLNETLKNFYEWAYLAVSIASLCCYCCDNYQATFGLVIVQVILLLLYLLSKIYDGLFVGGDFLQSIVVNFISIIFIGFFIGRLVNGYFTSSSFNKVSNIVFLSFAIPAMIANSLMFIKWKIEMKNQRYNLIIKGDLSSFYTKKSLKQRTISKTEKNNRQGTPENRKKEYKIINKIKRAIINYAIQGKEIEEKDITTIKKKFVPKYDCQLFDEALSQLVAEGIVKLIDDQTFVGTKLLEREKEKRKYNVIPTVGLVILVAGVFEVIRFTPTEFAVGMIFVGIGATTLIVSFIMRKKK